ncbi:MAG TPA: hypothetical protein VGM56_15445 [Byssovorax sp.]
MAVARAPGKLVVAGAYAVLEGATSIVAAVDRYATADSGRPPTRVTEEVAAAIAAGHLTVAPHFDASPLRAPAVDGATRKLGLGSSAAILVASLGAARAEVGLDERALRASVFADARAAHRSAQGGGSGVDVAASTFGGVLSARLDAGELVVQPRELPSGLVFVVYAAREAASTPALVAAVRGLRSRDSSGYAAAIDAVTDAAHAARDAARADGFVDALARQAVALRRLGSLASVPIVPDEIERLGALARAEDAAFGPSGAGGGDVALFVGLAAPSTEFDIAARAAGLERLDIALGPRGLHVVGAIS